MAYQPSKVGHTVVFDGRADQVDLASRLSSSDNFDAVDAVRHSRDLSVGVFLPRARAMTARYYSQNSRTLSSNSRICVGQLPQVNDGPPRVVQYSVSVVVRDDVAHSDSGQATDILIHPIVGYRTGNTNFATSENSWSTSANRLEVYHHLPLELIHSASSESKIMHSSGQFVIADLASNESLFLCYVIENNRGSDVRIYIDSTISHWVYESDLLTFDPNR